MTTEYFVTLIYLKADGTEDHSTTKYATLDEAERAYYNAMVVGMGKEEYVKVSAMAFTINDGLTINFRRVWVR